MHSRNFVAIWHADSPIARLSLFRDGTTVVSQEVGQLCILKLFHGNHRIPLAEAEALLRSGGRNAQ
jgi:hypothetical protein